MTKTTIGVGILGAGHGLGYEHLFTHEVADLVTAIGAETQPSPSFGEALQVQHVLHAVEQSAGQNSIWTATSGSAGQPASTALQGLAGN